MEDRRGVGTHPAGQEHVAELRHRRVGQDLLDVGLHQADGGGEDRRQRADHRHHGADLRRQLVERIGAHHDVDAGGDHGRGVDQGRHRRRTGHGVGQPDVERNLSALAGGAQEESQGDEGGKRQAQNVVALHHFRRVLDGAEELLVVEGSELRHQSEHPRQEAEVAHPVDDECLASGEGRELLIVVEADQQVRAQPHPFPADEGDEKVVAQDEHQHHAHEQVQVGEIALEAGLVIHVADREPVDPEAYEGDHEEHHAGERIEQEAHLDREIGEHPVVETHESGRDPLVERLLESLACGVLLATQIAADRQHRDHKRRQHRAAGDDPHALLADAIAQDHAVEQGAEERQHRDEPEQSHPDSSVTLSSSVVWRRRKSATRMPSPTAASPAATAMVKMAKICPVRSPWL